MLSTEQDSRYSNLEEMSTLALLKGINNEDRVLAAAGASSTPEPAPAAAWEWWTPRKSPLHTA